METPTIDARIFRKKTSFPVTRIVGFSEEAGGGDVRLYVARANVLALTEKHPDDIGPEAPGNVYSLSSRENVKSCRTAFEKAGVPLIRTKPADPDETKDIWLNLNSLSGVFVLPDTGAVIVTVNIYDLDGYFVGGEEFIPVDHETGQRLSFQDVSALFERKNVSSMKVIEHDENGHVVSRGLVAFDSIDYFDISDPVQPVTVWAGKEFLLVAEDDKTLRRKLLEYIGLPEDSAYEPTYPRRTHTPF
ncbi:MAG: hypothetical protein H6868_03760 [Rhodospirillales bacterium]|nr:hypothetical protein [Rhodospirillales bacterium]